MKDTWPTGCAGAAAALQSSKMQLDNNHSWQTQKFKQRDEKI